MLLGEQGPAGSGRAARSLPKTTSSRPGNLSTRWDWELVTPFYSEA